MMIAAGNANAYVGAMMMAKIVTRGAALMMPMNLNAGLSAIARTAVWRSTITILTPTPH